MRDHFVMISFRELRNLIESSARYDALEEMGVDNWQWYGEVDWYQVEEDIKEKLMEFGI